MTFEWCWEHLRRVLRPSSRDLALCLQKTWRTKPLFLGIVVVPTTSSTQTLDSFVLSHCMWEETFHMTSLYSHDGQKRNILLFYFFFF